jgi:hypothetical protein
MHSASVTTSFGSITLTRCETTCRLSPAGRVAWHCVRGASPVCRPVALPPPSLSLCAAAAAAAADRLLLATNLILVDVYESRSIRSARRHCSRTVCCRASSRAYRRHRFVSCLATQHCVRPSLDRTPARLLRCAPDGGGVGVGDSGSRYRIACGLVELPISGRSYVGDVTRRALRRIAWCRVVAAHSVRGGWLSFGLNIDFRVIGPINARLQVPGGVSRGS